MTTMLEKAGKAAAEASAVRPYGLYDYTGYAGSLPPFVVRAEGAAGREIFRTDDRAEAHATYERLTREYVARAVLLAIREPDATVTRAMGKESYPDSGSYTRWQAGIDAILAEETGT